MNFLLAVLFAATAAATGPISESYAKGETLDYTVSWMKVAGGTARMTITPGDGNTWRITSVAKSGGGLARFVKIRDQIETIVARDDFSTLRYTKRLDERGDKMEEVTTIEDGIATRKRKKIRKIPVKRPIYDPISVIYYFRTLELAPGKTYELDLISDGKLYTVHGRVIRREKVTTPAGTFDALLVEPQMASAGVQREERLFIWYTDDERHLPVRIRTEVKFGSVTATLKSVTPGVTSIDPPNLPR
ncbi:MAG TPA: DUF3108 domain-containing protein [Thermoanaerobaculia bacterium]|nr:DUF3108 domain-containing protein [Thermoanaerobaculia bacterium]